MASIALSASIANADIPATPAPVRGTVHNDVLHSIDVRVFGQFVERWPEREPGPEAMIDAQTGVLNPEVVELMAQMASPVSRFPGGNQLEWGPLWTHLIDGAYDRDDPARPEGYAFGYDEFLNLCEAQGTEPLLVVSMSKPLVFPDDLSWRDSYEYAAALVAYCNAPVDADLPENLLRWARLRAENGRVEPWNVRYWQIGNEPFHIFHRPLSRQNYEPRQIAEMYVKQVGAHIDAVKSVDPDAIIFVENHFENNVPEMEITGILHETFGDRIDYLTYHIYQPWEMKEIRKNREPVDPDTFTNADFFRAAVSVPGIQRESGQAVLNQRAYFAAEKYGYNLAITEWNWNGWFLIEGRKDNSDRNDNHASGVGAASFLHAIMRRGERVHIANQSMQVGTDWAITSIHVPKQDESFPPLMTGTGLATMLYRHHHGDRMLRLELSENDFYEQPFRLSGIRAKPKVAYLDVLATRNDDTLFLHVINRDADQARSLKVQLEDFARETGTVTRHSLVPKPEAQWRQKRLDRSRLVEVPVEASSQDGSMTLEVPARSANVFAIELTGG